VRQIGQRRVGRNLTWRTVAREADQLRRIDQEILELIGRLPLVPMGQLLPFSAVRGPRAVYACISRLAARGLVITIVGPGNGVGPRHHLLLLSNLGLAVLSWRRNVEPAGLAREWGLHQRALRTLISVLPAQLGSYALLGLLARTGPHPALLQAWSRRWRWDGSSRPGRSCRGLTFAAYVALAWGEVEGKRLNGSYLLVADAGGLSPVALRPELAALARLARTAKLAVPTLVIGTTSERRVDAWLALLEGLESSRNAGPLQARVDTWRRWHAQAGTTPPPGPITDAHSNSYAVAGQFCNHERQPWKTVPRPIDVSTVTTGVRDWDLAPRERTVLDIVGRHPFLPRRMLADVLGKDICWARARHSELRRRGLARVLLPEELPLDLRGQRDLLELTVGGLQMLAGYLDLSMPVAVCVHGMTGGGPVTPIGPRRALLANLAHTLGTDRVFAEIARAARSQRGKLLEWRNAAACTHGRVRPDGYGLLRLGGREYGFFLEFDRGTIRPAALRAKFVAYQRYRSSARSARDYDGFPSVLVVTNGPGAEERLSSAIRAANAEQGSPLPALVTTVGWMDNHPAGLAGPIWVEPETGLRRAWPGASG
jgi:hypothetical protein